jgi:TRAP-type mannitol/chloroaromatic compound transport system permease small subunit
MKLEVLLKGIDGLNEFFGKAVSWLFLALIASVCIDLFMRALTGRSTVWAFDINYMIYGVNFMLAGAYTLKYDGHVRVDVLYMKFSSRGQAILEIIFYILIMFPLCLFLLNATWEDFLQAWASKEISIVSSWHPPVYHYKGIMPLAFALLFLQSIVLFIRNILTLKKGNTK